jgi:ribonuclease BN (tRNA processing enzyme)
MDHILGFPFFKPIYIEKASINLMGCPTTQGDISKLLSKAMSAPFFPIQYDQLKAKIHYASDCPVRFRIDSIEIFPINLSHPNLGMGYKFLEDGKTFVFLTDNELGYRHRDGLSFDEYAAFSKDADLLMHDAEYTPEQYKSVKTWGHSHYIDALDLALAARVKRFGLFHHNQDRSDADQDLIVKDCRDIIQGKNMDMECFALTQTTELTL